MFSKPITQVLEPKKFLTAGPDASVREAALSMARAAASAVLVVDAGRLLGIFTERDVVVRVVAEGREADGTLLREVMTPRPYTIVADKSLGAALTLMQQHGVRHLPVMQGDKAVGIVSARSALDPDLEDFVCEARRREHMAEG